VRFRLASTVAMVLGLFSGGFSGAANAQAFGLPAANFAAGGAGLTSFYVIGFELGPWQDYLARELTPAYMLAEDAPPIRISWLKSNELTILPDFAQSLIGTPETYFRLDFELQNSAEYMWNDPVQQERFKGTSFERQYFAPGVEHQLDSGGVLGVSAVIAYQRYSAANMGLWSATETRGHNFGAPTFSPYQDTSYGAGVRLALHQEVVKGVTFKAGFQSRIDMEEFAAYRGIYSQPADLDIPARASVGLDFQASKRSWLNVAVERVLYSDLNAFASRNLPDRFLSLLGDSTSPSFAWEDLTIYSVGWTWSDGKTNSWHVDYSTRPQPSPTSATLSRALQGDLAKSAVVLGYSRKTTIRSQLHFNAAYAPSEFAFGGSVLGVTTEKLDQRLELEALWSVSF
jgi:hypothetical protein